MRQAFFEYLGDKDSLAGYQRSNRLVFLKTFFDLCDRTGKALVSDVVNGYSDFYYKRKEKGFIADLGADVAVENIENSTHSEILNVIKRHPYRVLSERGFFTISKINNQDYFMLNEMLNISLSEGDISNIRLLLEQKISLYYSKVNNIEIDRMTTENVKGIQESKVENIFSESRYLQFRKYCEECNIVFISQIEPIDFVAFRSKTGATSEFINEIKKRINEITSGGALPTNLANKEFNFSLEPKSKDTDIYDKCSRTDIVISYEEPLVNEEKETDYGEGILISNIFTDRIFNNFNQFCIDNNFKFIKDLSGFNFKNLLNIKGFGVKRVEKITAKYNDFIETDTSKESENMHAKLLVSNKMKLYIEKLLGLNNDFDMNNHFTEEELNILDEYNNSINELGIEMCKNAYQNPQEALIIAAVLDSFASKTAIEKERTEKLYNAFNNISNSNKELLVSPLIMAYTVDSMKVDILKELFENDTTVKKMSSKIEIISENYSWYIETVRFMEWLHDDLIEFVLKSYKEIYKRDVNKKVIECRANGETLEEVGHMLNVSRERVRQIEKNIQLKFDSHNSRKRYIWVMSALCGGKKIIGVDELVEYLGEEAHSFIYLLKNSVCEIYSYSDELEVYIIGEHINLSGLKNIISELPDILYESDIDSVIEKIIAECNVTYDIVRIVLLDSYKPLGKVFYRKRITLTEIYEIVLNKYYPSGVKLFDKSEQDRFRRYIKETFGSVKLPSSYRALDARLTDIGILCDRGTYIHPDHVKVEISLLNEIFEYVQNGERVSYTFLELYEIYKDKLLVSSSINNRYYLQGVLKYHFKEYFYFTKDMISKSADIERIDDQIEEFIGSYETVSKDQIRNKFTGITESMLFFAIGRCRNIITVENGIYMHTKHLKIYDSDYDVSNIIDRLTVDIPISSRKLLEIMYTTHAEFLNRNQVFSHTKLFSILQYMLKGKYKFSRPLIAKLDTESLTKIGVVKNFLNGRDFYEISELIEFCEEHHLNFLSWATLVEDLSDEFLRADSNLCVNVQQIDIDEGKVETIKNIIKDIIKIKGYLSARKIRDFMFFPDIGVEWNGYLLKSIIEKYVSDVVVIQIPTSDTYALSAVFLNEDFNYDNYEEFLRGIIKSEHNYTPFRSLDEVRQWLQEEDLINQNIPKFMFDKHYLYVDEFGKIVVE